MMDEKEKRREHTFNYLRNQMMEETNEMQAQMQNESQLDKEYLLQTHLTQLREEESKRNKEMLTK